MSLYRFYTKTTLDKPGFCAILENMMKFDFVILRVGEDFGLFEKVSAFGNESLTSSPMLLGSLSEIDDMITGMAHALEDFYENATSQNDCFDDFKYVVDEGPLDGDAA